MNLAPAFAASSERNSSNTALFWGESEWSYATLLERSVRTGACLRDTCKVAPGARVGLWLKNCPDFVWALFGTWFADAVVVPINNFLRPCEVAYMLADAEIDVLISETALNEGLEELVAGRPGLRVVLLDELDQLQQVSGSESAPLPRLTRSKQDLAMIVYTSGTTGHPKGAMLTHGNLLHNVESCRIVLEAVSFDRFVVLLPMFHSFMMTVGILLPLLVGGSIVLIKSLHSPKSIITEAIAREATILPAIPQFFRAMANAQLPPKLSLRLCISGAAPLPGEVLREFNAHVPVPLLEGYGLSEASPVVSINPISGPWKAGSIGVPIPDVEVSVQNDAGELLPPHQVGEICVRGGNVMVGYWNQPEETAKALRSGWLLTGDVGYCDEEGYYFITDRKKDMLLVNGINVYPREIEEVLYQFPGVKEVAVVGIPDSRRGEQPLAFVAPKDGVQLDERNLLQFAKERLADYKVPRRAIFLANLPRNATGKILKTTLRQQAV
ncbi:MAG: long-chain fatty acid--CoA ligase [Verrucomicrobiia bacterium]